MFKWGGEVDFPPHHDIIDWYLTHPIRPLRDVRDRVPSCFRVFGGHSARFPCVLSDFSSIPMPFQPTELAFLYSWMRIRALKGDPVPLSRAFFYPRKKKVCDYFCSFALRNVFDLKMWFLGQFFLKFSKKISEWTFSDCKYVLSWILQVSRDYNLKFQKLSIKSTKTSV